MEDTESPDTDQILLESGLTAQDCAGMTLKEKEDMAEAIKTSQRDVKGPSTSTPQSFSSVVRDESKTLNIESESNLNRAGSKKPGPKPQSGQSDQVKDNNSNVKTTCDSNPNLRLTPSPNDEQIVDGARQKNENGISSKQIPSLNQQEDMEKSDGKETVNDIGSNLDARTTEPLEKVEEELVSSLMEIVFENREFTSRFPKSFLPPFSLCKADWVKEMGQRSFELKVSKIKSEARRSKWVTMSQRTYSLSLLERITSKSPTASIKEDSSSCTESHNINLDISKAIDSLERPNNYRESSPETCSSKETNWITKDSDSGPSEITSSTGPLKKPGKSETLAGNTSDKNEDDGNNESEQHGKTRRKRNKYSGGGRQKCPTRPKGPVASSMNSPVHDDNSKSEYNFVSSPGRGAYTHNSEDFPTLDGTLHIESRPTEKKRCPICSKEFAADVVEGHAWTCNESPEEVTRQVAAKEENGSDSDVMVVETCSEEKILESQNPSNGYFRSSARIRMKRSGGEWLSKEDRPSKNLRK